MRWHPIACYMITAVMLVLAWKWPAPGHYIFVFVAGAALSAGIILGWLQQLGAHITYPQKK